VEAPCQFTTKDTKITKARSAIDRTRLDPAKPRPSAILLVSLVNLVVEFPGRYRVP
jgi:hypothetical protein